MQLKLLDQYESTEFLWRLQCEDTECIRNQKNSWNGRSTCVLHPPLDIYTHKYTTNTFTICTHHYK